jgi:hypothetical protein
MLSLPSLGCDRGSGYLIESNAGSSSGGTPSGPAVGGGGSGIMLNPITPNEPCKVLQTPTPLFGERTLTNAMPARRELFTWTTAEQAAELRAEPVLLTRTEREGLGPGYAMEVLAELGSTPPLESDPMQAQTLALAALLSGPQFAKARYAWSEPWATRAGWPGESYGDQLVRLVLRPEAWLARYQAGQLDVVDMDNTPVALADALAHPERLAGVFFVRDSSTGGPQCFGSFRGGDDGYREFIIGNEAMIEEWSLGTSEIRARLEQDIALVQGFLDRVRLCPPAGSPGNWNNHVVCSWTDDAFTSELDAYGGALAIPSANYYPTAPVLAALLDALEASLFEPEPRVVTPDAPAP